MRGQRDVPARAPGAVAADRAAGGSEVRLRGHRDAGGSTAGAHRAHRRADRRRAAGASEPRAGAAHPRTRTPGP